MTSSGGTGSTPTGSGRCWTRLRLSPTLLHRRPGQVFGGELQRLAVARALLLDHALVFADEPTSRPDLITQEEASACLVEQLERTGCALVLVTHDGELARAVADRITTPDARRPSWTSAVSLLRAVRRPRRPAGPP